MKVIEPFELTWCCQMVRMFFFRPGLRQVLYDWLVGQLMPSARTCFMQTVQNGGVESRNCPMTGRQFSRTMERL